MVIAGLVSLSVLRVGMSTALADAQPPPDAITHVGEFANFRANAGPGADYHTVLFADQGNRLIFAESEYPGLTRDSCTYRIKSYDFATLAPLASGCLPNSVNMIGARPGAGGGSYNVLGAADSADHLLFVTGHQETDAVPTVRVLNESSLGVLDTWALPAGATPTRTVAGMSWSASNDSLLVLSDNLDLASGAPVVTLSSIDVHASMKGGGSTPVVRWQLLIPQCSLGLRTAYGTANPYLTRDASAAFVPCQLAGNVNTLSEGSQTIHQGSYGIVKVTLDGGGCTPATNPIECPSQTTVAPSPISDVIYDAVSERAVVTYVTASSFSLNVYDGAQEPPAFIGRLDAGGGLSSSIAFDEQTGRLYTATTGGLTAIDIRRTPFAPGIRESQLTGSTFSKVLPVLPADGTHPYPRLLVDFKHGETLPSFGVYADTIAMSTDPPASDVDLNTKNGIALGTRLSITYSGAASGFGVHADYVGGPGAAVYNNADGPDTGASADSARFIGGTRDLVGGWVRESHLGPGVSSASATALGDGNGSTAADLAACSSVSNGGECDHSTSGIPIPSAALTGAQPWPFPDAQCDRPGADAVRSSVTGTFWSPPSPGTTTSSSSQSLPSLSLGPAKIDDASASVDCAGTPQGDGVTVNGSVIATSNIDTVSMPSGGIPSVSIMGASTETMVQPPSNGAGVTSQTIADARGIRIEVPGHTLNIGEVRQVASATAAGVNGSAVGTDSVTISDVSLDGSELCTVCTPSNLATINAAAPMLVDVIEPAPDEAFGPRVGDRVPGSPGGYEAVVQANVLEQQGDEQFNFMSPGQAVLHPALRIVLYENSSGETNREVVDLAGAEADAEQGIDVLETPPPPPPTPPNIIIEQQAAGYITTTTPGPPTVITRYARAGGSRPNGIVAVVQQVMSGLQYLVRSPLQVLRMFIVLCVLGLPLFLMIRRRTWLAER